MVFLTGNTNTAEPFQAPKTIFYSKFGRRLKNLHHAEIQFRHQQQNVKRSVKTFCGLTSLVNVPVILGQARIQQ